MATAAPITAMAASIGCWAAASGRPHRRPQVAVTQANLFQDRDWPVLNDYRALIGGVLRKAYGLSQTQLAQIFPSAQPAGSGAEFRLRRRARP